MSAGRYALLASAVAERRIGVIDEPAGPSWWDGEAIHLAPHEDRELLRAGVVAQAALLAAGSLDRRTVARLAGRERPRRRYLTLEAIRAVEACAVAPRSVAERVGALYGGPRSASPRESLQRALGREDIPPAPDWLGTIKPGRLLRVAASDGPPTDAPAEPGTDPLDDDEGGERSRILELFSSPVAGGPLARQIQKLLGMGSSPKADGAGGEELPVGDVRAGSRLSKAARRATAPVRLRLDRPEPALGRRHPEWDCERRRYKPDWCAVAEFDPRLDGEAEPLDVHAGPRLQRELARLGIALARHRRQHDGDVLDLGALIDHVVDRRAGVAPDPRIYETKRKTAHDLGVLVLLDATGSTGASDDSARTFDEQRRLAAQLIAGFDALGNRVAAYGFQSWGRQSVRFLRVKAFDDRYGQAAMRRLGALEPTGFTRLGAAVRHATRLLAEDAGTAGTLLVVVGDGLPYDDGYEHRYAQEDTRRALHEAVAAGVGCACLSVRSSTDPAIVERVWGNVPHRRIERPEDLERHAAPLFRSALREAEASRR